MRSVTSTKPPTTDAKTKGDQFVWCNGSKKTKSYLLHTAPDPEDSAIAVAYAVKEHVQKVAFEE